jgi:hypothetical protein
MSDALDNAVLGGLRRIDERIEQLGNDAAKMRSEFAMMRHDMVLIYYLIERMDAHLDRVEARLERGPGLIHA